MENKKQPVTQMKQGRVRASIWASEGKKGTFYNATFSRAYPAGDGVFKFTSSFSNRDLKIIQDLIPKLLQSMPDEQTEE